MALQLFLLWVLLKKIYEKNVRVIVENVREIVESEKRKRFGKA